MNNNSCPFEHDQKPVVLAFIGSYLPGYKSGGPLKSMTNLVDRLSDRFSFRIVCNDRDMGDHSSYPGIRQGEWTSVGKAQVNYLAPDQQRRTTLRQILRAESYDFVYCNSFFSFMFSCYPLLVQRLGMAAKSPVVLAPRGEFAESALAIKSGKKKLYLAGCRSIGLHRNIIWQATSDHEVKDIRRVMGPVAQSVFYAPNLSSPTETTIALPVKKTNEPLNVVYLSRIVPVKNLMTVIQTLSRITCSVNFDIYGPIEDENYWQQCQQVIAQLPAHVTVRHCGPLHPREVQQKLLAYDLFFLPTRGENYGHVIVEAFQAGLPVLISDQTPWRGLEQLGVGKDCPPDNQEQFAAYIHKISQMSPEEHQVVRRKSLEFGQSISQADGAVNQYVEMFEAALKQGQRA